MDGEKSLRKWIREIEWDENGRIKGVYIGEGGGGGGG